MATKTKVLTMVGGISKDSLNQKLSQSLHQLAPSTFEFTSFDLSTLPFFSQDLENNPPISVRKFKELVKQSGAVLIVTPEYNRSFPGVLKNAIDWGSRPYGQNLWKGKPAGLLGATPGNIGTFGAQHHLRQVLSYLDVRVMAQPEFYLKADHAFDEEGKLKDEKLKDLLKNFWQAFSVWVEDHQLRDKKEEAQATSTVAS